MDFSAITKNPKTTLMGLLPAIPYILQYFHLWPDSVIPLPAFSTVWPSIAGAIGLGYMAKDHSTTGGA